LRGHSLAKAQWSWFISAPVLLHASGYYLDARSRLRILVRQDEIRNRWAGFSLGRIYAVRPTMAFDVGVGSPAGDGSESFIERTFLTHERSQAITRNAASEFTLRRSGRRASARNSPAVK
jgi:hypothetical protein